jgi:hypothetical protein
MAKSRVTQGTRTSETLRSVPIFAAELQRSPERNALAKLPERAQRAALAAMHLERASLAQVIAAIEVLARRDKLWDDGCLESIDICLMLIRGTLTRGHSDIDPKAKAKVISLKTFRALRLHQAKSMVACANEAEVPRG